MAYTELRKASVEWLNRNGKETARLRTELAKYKSVQMPCVPVAMGDE